jgi:hypothetical protein
VLSKDSGQRSNGPLTRSIFQRGLGPLVIAQHKLLGIGMQVDLLVYPVGNRVAVQVMLQQRNLLPAFVIEGKCPIGKPRLRGADGNEFAPETWKRGIGWGESLS